jgi:twitching motility protein PilT
MISESIRGVVCQRLIPRDDGQGRAMALEVMFNVPAIGNLIREERIYQIPNMMKVNRNSGNVCLEESIQQLMEKKVVNSTEAYYVVNEYLIFEQGKSQEKAGN